MDRLTVKQKLVSPQRKNCSKLEILAFPLLCLRLKISIITSSFTKLVSPHQFLFSLYQLCHSSFAFLEISPDVTLLLQCLCNLLILLCTSWLLRAHTSVTGMRYLCATCVSWVTLPKRKVIQQRQQIKLCNKVILLSIRKTLVSYDEFNEG